MHHNTACPIQAAPSAAWVG